MLRANWPAAHRESVMGTARTGHGRGTPDPRPGFDGAVVELALLLTCAEATAPESVARARGMTVGQLLRCLIRECLARPVVGVISAVDMR